MIRNHLVRFLRNGVLTFALATLVPAAGMAKPQQLTIFSGSPGGSWYPISAGLSKNFADSGVPSNAEVGGALSNMVKVSAGQGELGFTMTNVPPLAGKGAAPFKKPIDDVVGLAVLFSNLQHIGVRKDSGINAIPELKGRKFASQAVGNATQEAFATVLAAYGLSEDDLDLTRGSQTSDAAATKDRNVVGMTALTAYPASTWTELFTTVDMKLLPLDGEAFAKVHAQNPGYSLSEFPAGTYPGQDKAVPALKADTILVAAKAMSEEDAYWIVKTMLDKIDSLTAIHASLRGLSPAAMADVNGLPLHSGAIRAYKEAGVPVK